MRIAVMGAGALGGYFGGRLSAAGHDVCLIARGAHLAAIQANGLRIESPKGDLHLPNLQATDDPNQVSPVDVILFSVKNYDVETAAEAIRPMLGPRTMVVTCQNGITAPQRLGAIIGIDHVVPGVARFPGSIPAPGLIRHGAASDTLLFGEADGVPSARCKALEAAMTAAGMTAAVSGNIVHDLWAKLIAQSAVSSITTLTRLDIGPLRENPATRQLLLDAMREAEKVGRAAIPDLPAGLMEDNWAVLNSFPRTMHASMLDDLLKGGRIEVDYMSGDVVRVGRQYGVETPLHSMFHAALQPFVDGPPS